MKMGKLEKLFVNSDGHSQTVGQHAEKLLGYAQVQPGQCFLDVGTGNGYVPIHLSRHYGLNVTGVDIDPEQIELARANSQGMGGLRFLTLDGTRLPFEDGEFDVVFTNKVTHHIPNWQEAFQEMVRVVKPGGSFIYADLVYPQALATIGASIAGKKAGFPTRDTVKALLTRYHMSTIYESKSPLHFEGVYRRPLNSRIEYEKDGEHDYGHDGV